MVLLQRGGGGPTSSRGKRVSKETHITCDFPGGGGPDLLTPLRIRTWGRLLHMVYQNLNKTEKYHPTTTRRKKAISCWSRYQVRIQRGVRGQDPPGKSQVIWISIGYKQLDPPGKVGPPPPHPPENVDPLWNLEK